MTEKTTTAKLVTECTRIYGAKSMGYPPDIAKKIVKQYFERIAQVLLSGNSIKVANLGTVSVEKRHRPISKQIYQAKMKRPISSIKFDYPVIWNSAPMEKFGYEFNPSSTFSKALFKNIATNDVQYLQPFT